MNESINPLFITGIVSFSGKPYTQSMQKPSATCTTVFPGPGWRVPPAFKRIFAFWTSQVTLAIYLLLAF